MLSNPFVLFLVLSLKQVPKPIKHTMVLLNTQCTDEVKEKYKVAVATKLDHHSLPNNADEHWEQLASATNKAASSHFPKERQN